MFFVFRNEEWCKLFSFGIDIFSENFINAQGWTASQASTPYAAAIAAFALVMLVGGKLQDRLGPRIVITIAGLCTAAGMFLCSAMPTKMGVILGFGVLNGAGIGLGYSATAPAAVKWFKPEQKGLMHRENPRPMDVVMNGWLRLP